MKTFAVLILVVCAAFVKSDEMMMKVMEGCKATTGASDEDMQKFMTHVSPENQVQKCLLMCTMSGLGVVSRKN